MHRRSIVTSAATGLAVGLVGCFDDDGHFEVTATEPDSYEVDLEASTSVEVTIRNDAGLSAGAELVTPDGEEVVYLETDGEASDEVVVDATGTYEVWVYPDEEATVRVTSD